MGWKATSLIIGMLMLVGLVGFVWFHWMDKPSGSEQNATPIETTSETGRSSEKRQKIDEQAQHWDPQLDVKISKFISENHEFYNQTLGWGMYRRKIDWNKQAKQAENILSEIKELLPAIDEHIKLMKTQGLIADDDDKVPPLDPRGLKKDLEHELPHSIEKVIKEKNTKQLLHMHRIFHSLDMAFNGYKSKDTWSVSFYASGY